MQIELTNTLNKLYSGSFADAKNIMDSLRNLTLDQKLSPELIAFTSNKIFYSTINLFKYVETSIKEKDKLGDQIRKNIYKLIGDYIKLRKSKIVDYIELIYSRSYNYFLQQQSNKPKEAAIRIIIKIVKHMQQKKEELSEIIKPKQLCKSLFDSLKTFKLVPTIKGSMWYLLGMIYSHYPSALQVKIKRQLQQTCLKQLEIFVESDKNVSVIAKLIKTLNQTLSQNYLEPALVNKLFKYLKVLIKPLKDTYQVVKSALKALNKNSVLFHNHIMGSALELFNEILELMGHQNRDVKQKASQALQSTTMEIVKGILQNTERYEGIYHQIMNTLWGIIKRNTFTFFNKNIQGEKNNFESAGKLVCVIRTIGYFSSTILKISKKQKLQQFFSRLLQICDKRMIKSFEAQQIQKVQTTKVKNLTSMKTILYRQKQIFSFLSSFAKIIQNLQQISHFQAQQLESLFLLAVRQHTYFYEKYMSNLFQSLVHLIIGFSNKSQLFNRWLKRTIMGSIKQSLDTNRFIIVVNEDYFSMIKRSYNLWHGIFSQALWTANTLKEFSNIFFESIEILFKNLDISYRNIIQQKQENEIAKIFSTNTQNLKASNVSDYQYMCSLVLLYNQLLRSIPSQLYHERVHSIYIDIIRRFKLFPRSLPLMKICRTLNHFITKTKYFDKIHQNIKNQLISAIKNLFNDMYQNLGRYQRHFLYQSLKLLMSLPIQVIAYNDFKILKYQLPTILLKGLDLGQQIPSLALQALKCLQNLFQEKKKSQKYISLIIPELEKYISVKEKQQNTVEDQNLFLYELLVNKEKLMNESLQFLGKMGGLSHCIVPQFKNQKGKLRFVNDAIQFGNRTIQDNYISWDHESKITFPLPLLKRKIDLNITKILPRILYLMLNSTEEATKVTACQFMHAIIIYIIGKSASNPKRNLTEAQLQQQTSFKQKCSKIYQKILPGIFKISCSPSHPSHQLMHTLSIQLIHFLSNTQQPNSPDILVLLQLLLDMLSCGKDMSQFASKCLSQLVKWNIKQLPIGTKDYQLIKMVIRNIWSLVTSKKSKQGTISLLTQILKAIHKQQALMSKYLLQFCSIIIAISRNNKPIEANFNYLIQKLILTMRPYIKMLIIENPNKSACRFPSILKLIDWLYEHGIFSYFSQQREISFYLWQNIIGQYGDILQFNISQYLKRNSIRETITLFSKTQLINFSNNYEELIKNCSKFNAQSELYYKIIKNQYFQVDNLIRFSDFDKIYLSNITGFFNLLNNINLKKNIFKQYETLGEEAIEYLIDTFYKVIQLFELLFRKDSIKQRILSIFYTNFDQAQFNKLLTIMLIKPQQLIKGLNSDSILLNYSSVYFQSISNVLNHVAFKDFLKSVLLQQYDNLFCYLYEDKHSLINWIIFNTDLYDSQFFVFLKGQQKINGIISNQSFVRRQLEEVIRIIENIFEKTEIYKKQISNERVIMLLSYLFSHINQKIVFLFVLKHIKTNSHLFQKYQKLWFTFMTQNWHSIGKQFLTYSLQSINLIKILVGLSKMISKENISKIYNLLPQIQKTKAVTMELLQQQIKLNYILMADIKEQLSIEYIMYGYQLIKSGLQISNNINMHESTFNFLSLMLKQKQYKSLFLKQTKEEIKKLKHKYLPLKIELLTDQRSRSQFTLFLKSFKTLVSESGQIQLFECILSIIRQNLANQPYFSKLINQIVNDFIELNYNQKNHKNMIIWTLEIYFNETIDNNCYENARCAVAQRFTCKLIQKSQYNAALEIYQIYTPKLIDIIERPIINIQPIDNIALILKIKKAAYMLLEQIYKRIPSKKQLEALHKFEYHKRVIKSASDTIKKKFEYEALLKENDKIPTNKSIMQILRQYYCSAYNCLIRFFIQTQQKKENFKIFIFDRKNKPLWEQIVDPELKQFNFQVETNFQEMKPIELQKAHKISKSKKIKQKYWESSLFTIQEQYVPKSQFIESIENPSTEIKQMEQQPPKPQTQSITLELDIINRHPCMINLLTVIDFMDNTFSETGVAGWMGCIYEQLSKTQCPLSIQIFLIKLIINRPNIFTHDIWLPILMNYLSLKENGAKYFHYFFRDVAKQAISYIKMGYKIDGRTTSLVINKILKILPHENNFLFTDNVNIFQGFLKIPNIFIEDSTLVKMLKFQQNKENYLEWRLTALVVLKCCVMNKVPIINTYEDLMKSTEIEEKLSFFFKMYERGIVRLISNIMQQTRQKYAIAAAGFIGQLLKFIHENQKNIKNKQNLFGYIVVQLSSLANSNNRTLRQRFPLVLNQITHIFPPLLQDMKLFGLAEDGFYNYVRRQRALIIQSYILLLQYLFSKRIPFESILQRICLSLRGCINKIILDGLEVHRELINLLTFLSEYSVLVDKNTYQMFYYIFDDIEKTYSSSVQQDDSRRFYEIIIKLDDYLKQKQVSKDDSFGILQNFSKKVKRTLIKGLSSQHKVIRNLIYLHFENDKKQYDNPSQKLLAVFKQIYTPQFQELWITTTVPLIISLSKKSSDYQRYLFDETLDKLTNFYDWDFRLNFKQNSSQPYTPSFTLSTQLIKKDPAAAASIQQQESQLEGLIRSSQNYLIEGSPIFTILQPSQSKYSSSIQQSQQEFEVPQKSAQGNQFLLNMFKRPQKKVNSTQMSNFLHTNAISYSNISIVQGNKIRFNKNGKGTANQAELLNRQTDLYLKRIKKSNKNILVRKYKVGELPDIQITSKDLIDPMMLLAFNDSELASQLFSLLFESLCKSQSLSIVKHFKTLIPELINQSTKFNFNFISTLQKSLIILCKEMKQNINFNMCTIAQKSNSYDYSVLFIQENLIQIIKNPNINGDIKPKTGNQMESSEEQFSYWLDLMQLYHHICQDDHIQGILLKVMGLKQRQELLNSIKLKNMGKVAQASKGFQILYKNNQNDRIKKFIQNQRIDCQTLLANWQEVSIQLTTKNKQIQLDELHSKLLITSLVNSSTNDSIHKLKELSLNFNPNKLYYQQAILALACKNDIDRPKYFASESSKYFSNQWQKLSSFALRSKHQLLQILQKNYQLKEFLQLYSSIDLSIYDCKALFNRWKERSPSEIYDNNFTWIQILQGRLLFSRLIADRYGIQDQVISNANTDWLVQIANGMVKKGILGGAQSLIKKAIVVKRNNRLFSWEFYKSTAKLKLKQLIAENNTKITDRSFADYDKIPNIILKQMSKHQNIANETKLKMNLLQIKSYESFLDVFSIVLSDKNCPQEFVNQYADTIQKTLKLILQICRNDAIIRQNIEDKQIFKIKQKTYIKFTCFAEKILTMIQGKFEIKNIIPPLSRKKITVEKISELFIQSLIKSLQLIGLGRQNIIFQKEVSVDQISSLILKLLKVVQRHPEKLGDIFIEAINQKKIPVWIFLYFLPQVISVLSLPNSKYFQDFFMLIADLYPEALIYQFNCQYQRKEHCLTETCKKIYEKLHESYPNHFKFINALDDLNHPQLRTRDALGRLKQKENIQDAIKDLQDLIELQKETFKGKYNKKFAQDWNKKIKRLINKIRINDKTSSKDLDQLLNALRDPKIAKGYLKLSDFSTFFEQYATSDWSRIQLPGQYSNCGEQPLKQTKIYIQNFDQTLYTLPSIRRPKKLTFYGNNQKKYMLLVKGGQDIRLDQRIEQLFEVMNKIMSKNCQCQKRQLFIRRFQVTPMKKWMGVIQWVENTKVLRQFIERELKQIRGPTADLVKNNQSFAARQKFLEELSKEKDPIPKHLPLLSCDQRKIVNSIERSQYCMPYGLLRKALQRLSKNYDSYLHLKNRFLCNYAVSAVACYLLGVGDRHLDNFLIHLPTATIIMIDFGYSFGSSIDLSIPQLMPFRLTKIFRELMQPIGTEGIYKISMIHSLGALRNKYHQLIDFCEVFINDPVLDWIKISRKKKSNNQNNNSSSLFSQQTQQQSQEKQYFKKKIQFVHNKLLGYHPRTLMSEALMDSKHKDNKNYIANLRKTVEGKKQRKAILSVNQQAQSLIQMAMDKNILGRVYGGWNPYV